MEGPRFVENKVTFEAVLGEAVEED